MARGNVVPAEPGHGWRRASHVPQPEIRGADQPANSSLPSFAASSTKVSPSGERRPDHMAAKRTAELIPLCHPLPLTKVDVKIDIDDGLPGFCVSAEVRTHGVTGVEMEALTAVSMACLTLFDMLKAIDRSMVIGGIEVSSKTGGKSGDWQRTGTA